VKLYAEADITRTREDAGIFVVGVFAIVLVEFPTNFLSIVASGFDVDWRGECEGRIHGDERDDRSAHCSIYVAFFCFFLFLSLFEGR
jgi:hypothetical protein